MDLGLKLLICSSQDYEPGMFAKTFSFFKGSLTELVASPIAIRNFCYSYFNHKLKPTNLGILAMLTFEAIFGYKLWQELHESLRLSLIATNSASLGYLARELYERKVLKREYE